MKKFMCNPKIIAAIAAIVMVSACAAMAAATSDSGPFPLWDGPEIPGNHDRIPMPDGIEHMVIHTAKPDYGFLHGAAIINFKGTFFASWANSPRNENGPHETLRGRRSRDDCRTWSEPEMIGPDIEGPERRSHGVFIEHEGKLYVVYSISKEDCGLSIIPVSSLLQPQPKPWRKR